MSSSLIKYFMLTGEPGVGKTTLIKNLHSSLQSNAIKTSGFYTEEVRSNNTRDGFDIVTLDGQRGKLARDQRLLNERTKYQVSKYGVLINEFEDLALGTLDKTEPETILVIDEIGKMELFSMKFKNKVNEIFSKYNNIVLATVVIVHYYTTIPTKNLDPLISSIRQNKYAKVWNVTKSNRDNLHDEIFDCMVDAIMNKVSVIK